MVRRWVAAVLMLSLALGMMAGTVYAQDAEESALPLTETPTQAPTEEPTEESTQAPTQAPTEEPTEEPTEAPTQAPTEAPTQAPTEPPALSGSCGEDMSWKFDTTSGTLTISGTGPMDDCTEQPWKAHAAVLKKVVIGADVRTLGAGAFAGCSVLGEVVFEGRAPESIAADAFRGVKATVSYPGLDVSWTQDLLRNYGGTLSWKASIPGGGIGGVFGNKFTWHLLDGTLTITGDGHLNGWDSGANPPWYPHRSQVKKVVMTGKIWSIYVGAFRDMTKLTEISWPKDLNDIYSSAFNGCTSLTSVSIPNSVTMIGEYAFYGCTSLREVVLPNALKEIRQGAFGSCKALTTVNLPYGVTTIGKSAFSYSGLKDIVIQDKVTKLSDGIFQGCSALSRVKFKGDISSVGAKSFQGCYSLNTMQLPAGVKSVGENAFRDCGLDELVFTGNMPVFGSDAFSGTETALYYPRDNSSWDPTRLAVMEDTYSGGIRCYAGTPEDFDEPSGESEPSGETAPATEATQEPAVPDVTQAVTDSTDATEEIVQSDAAQSPQQPDTPAEEPDSALQDREWSILDFWPIAVAGVWFFGGSALTIWFFLIRKGRRR